MEIENGIEGLGEGTKTGKRSKKKEQANGKSDEQTKYFVDMKGNTEDLEKIKDLLREANNKIYGREILFKDLAIFAIKKLSNKELEKLQEQSLNEMEKIQRLLDEHNKKHGTVMSLGEFLVRKLNIQ